MRASWSAADGIDEFIWDLNVVGYHPDEQVELLKELAREIGLETRPTAYALTA